MKEENLKKMKKVSKISSIITKIVAILIGIGFFAIILCGFFGTYAVSQIKFDNKDNVIVFGEKFKLEEIRSEILVEDLPASIVDEFIDTIRDNGTLKNTLIVGSLFAYSSGILLLLMIIFLKGASILSNISKEEVFVEENCKKLNTIGFLIIGMFIVSLFFGIAIEILLDVSFELDISYIYFALIAATLSCVFRYGMDNIDVKKTAEIKESK